MNRTLVTAFWRQRLSSPIRVVILSMMITIPVLMCAAMPAVGLGALGEALPLMMVFAVGMIGQDVSSGVLHLLLARPIRRWEYVVNRWLAVGLAASGAVVLQMGLASLALAGRGSPPSIEQFGLLAGSRLFEVWGGAAAMTLFSSLIGGLGDLALYALGTIGIGLFGMIAQAKGWALAGRIGAELQALLAPKVDLPQIVAGFVSWHGIVSYLSSITLCMVIAIVVLNRKELSYASAG
jgi:ABC-type transport system involved in multi-copper enzyme maturation permease subunit